MRLFANANYDFLRVRRLAYIITAVMIVPGLLLALFRGVNYSIEFTGGTMLRVKGPVGTEVGAIRDALQTAGLPGAEIQTVGNEGVFVIRARTAAQGTDADDTQATRAAVTSALDQVMGQGQYEILKTGAVGPKVGSELRERALIAILLSFLVTLAYLAYRFEWRFGLAAIVATGHDILATIAFIGLLRIEVSLFIVAALLSIVGYSLNDTIVIFDRIRENLHKYKRDRFADVLNRSINETLPRTTFTGSTALGCLIALAVLGGDVVRPFALVMLFGVVVGTFSSIFIASPVLLAIEEKWPGAGARGVKAAAPKAGNERREPVPTR
jgi:preprotein translocase subunit SecF